MAVAVVAWWRDSGADPVARPHGDPRTAGHADPDPRPGHADAGSRDPDAGSGHADAGSRDPDAGSGHAHTGPANAVTRSPDAGPNSYTLVWGHAAGGKPLPHEYPPVRAYQGLTGPNRAAYHPPALAERLATLSMGRSRTSMWNDLFIRRVSAPTSAFVRGRSLPISR